MFMGKDGVKHYPLNRYVVDRDGNGNVVEIVTKELIHEDLLPQDFIKKINQQNMDGDSGKDSYEKDCEVYTHIRLDGNRWVWHQEVHNTVIPGSQSKAPKDANPWLVLRFNTVDGESYGRGRVGEFLGDFKSLDALSQALVEGSAAAAKVVFVVSPSSTTKPQSLAAAGNGAIIQGRPDDIGVVQVGKQADFATAANMIQSYERRLLEAFLVMNPRNAERVTAEEIRLTQLELESQLGGLFSLLTVEFLVPYLNRKLLVLQRTGELPRYPKDIVNPTIVAGINSLGRGQDRESLTMFLGTVAQTLGPEALLQFVNPDEAIKRLAAAQGIDVLNLVKSMDQMQQEQMAAQQQQEQMALANQAGQILKSPLMDPTKNADLQAPPPVKNSQPQKEPQSKTVRDADGKVDFNYTVTTPPNV